MMDGRMSRSAARWPKRNGQSLLPAVMWATGKNGRPHARRASPSRASNRS